MGTAYIHIRQLTLNTADLDQLLAIEALSFNTFDAYSREDFRRWLGYSPNLCLAAEIEGRVAGYVLSRITHGKAELASLAIHPAYRRHALGAALLDETTRRVKASGIPYIDLEVRKTNTAGLRFWKKTGFVVTGECAGFYEDGEAAIQMRKTIP